MAGPRLDWPHRRSTNPDSRLWRRIGTAVVRRRWAAAAISTLILLALATPLLGLRLGQPTNASLASTGGTAAAAVTRVDTSGLGAGLSQPIEILTTDPDRVRTAVAGIDGVAAVITPAGWSDDGRFIVQAWTRDDASSSAGATAAAAVRTAAEAAGARVGGTLAQDADFITAVYGNAWWVIVIIIVVTFLLLARALRSIVLPLKALLLNVVSSAPRTASPC